MKYSAKVIDHCSNPRNVGSFGKSDVNVGTGVVTSADCGDVIKLQIKVNPESRVIDEAKFKTFGCGAAIACSSLATEWLRGRTVDAALAIDSEDLVAEFDLPAAKAHGSVLAHEAIRAAVADYRRKSPAGGR